MIIPKSIRDRIVSLGPDLLFFGTRYVVSMLMRDKIMSIGDERCTLTPDLEQAAVVAAKPLPWDCGRGAILVLDRTSLELFDQLTPLDVNGNYSCRGDKLSIHLRSVYWLDDLLPEAGVSSIKMRGAAKLSLLSYEQIDQSPFWAPVPFYVDQGLEESEFKLLHDVYDWGAFGYIGHRRNVLDDVFLLIEPGEPDRTNYLERDAEPFLQPIA